MGIFSFLNPLLDTLFGPLLGLSYFWVVAIMSLILALLISLIYKYTTNQSLMRDLKSEIKEFQKEMKELKHDRQKMMEVQKKSMETNMKYMMHSMKPMLFTFIPIIIIFGWMNLHFAYYPIMPGQTFSTSIFLEQIDGEVTLDAPEGITLISEATQTVETNNATWKLKGKRGEYLLEYQYKGQSYTKDLIITTEKTYAEPIKSIKNGNVKAITVSHKPVKILDLHFRGWKLGWIGTYIIFSIIFSMLIRKWLKIY